jgi:uncharacterized protein YqjF (DUF2071 family)
MRLETIVRDLLVATWHLPAERVTGALPPGVEPALADDGRALVSLVGLRNTSVRLGGYVAPSFSQLNVRTYVTSGGEPALFLLAVRVTAAGLGGIAFGLPVRPAHISVRTGSVSARGSGVGLRYRTIGGAQRIPEAGGTPLGAHDVAVFVAAGLRRLVSSHEPLAWEEAELLEPPLVEPVAALGFDVGEPDSLLYAAATRFSLELPPERLG